jgi:hypothetical protein
MSGRPFSLLPLQQGQSLLRKVVGLCQNRDAGLHQNLVLCKQGRFMGDICGFAIVASKRF